jgi:glycosyltransferase involved in cell wall biosynthesis
MRWRRQYEKVDRFIAPSRFLRDILVAGGVNPERIEVVPNPIAVQGERGPGERDQPPTFVFAGRLVPEKGITTLLDAASMVQYPGARFVLYGSGPEEPAARARVKAERLPVQFQGYAPPNVVAAGLRIARAAILPSVWYENCPMVLLEAAALGTPAIASRIGGIPELIEEGVSGLLVPPADAVALAAAVDRLASDTDMAGSLGGAARRHVQWRHSPGAYLNGVLRAYEQAGAPGLPTTAVA